VPMSSRRVGDMMSGYEVRKQKGRSKASLLKIVG